MAEIITEKHCKQILSNISSISTLDSFQLKPLQEESLGGLIGLHFKLNIQYKESAKTKSLQCFVKVLNSRNQMMYKISKSLRFFDKEKLFYMKLLPLYEDKGIDTDFAPKGYLCEDNAVIIEDLSLSGYKLTSKYESLDLEHCLSCLTAIADFHASSLTYEIKMSESTGTKFNLFEEYPDLLSDLVASGGENYGLFYIQKTVESLIRIAELEFVDDTSLGDLKSSLMSDELTRDDFSNMRCVIIHADLWSNNFLHKYDENKRLKTKIIDFQLIKYGPPGLDVLQFIYSNTQEELRERYLEVLPNFYYEKLGEILHERGLCIDEILTKKEFFESCEELKVLAKFLVIIDKSLTCLPDEIYLEALRTEESFRDFLFDNRAEYVMKCYKNNPEYKAAIKGELMELKDMVCSAKKTA